MEEQQPPAQSPYISSSSGGYPPAMPEHPRPPHQEEEEEEEEGDEEDDPEERRPWEEDDFGDAEVLDLTGGAGGFKHPPFTVCFPGGPKEPEAAAPPVLEPHKPVREEKRKPAAWEEEGSVGPQPSWPEDAEVPPDRRPTAPAITPLASLAPAPIKEEPAPRRGPSGSADETFFALPAASASLMHSSAGSPDLQELPYKPVLPGREDFSSMLHESSASLPSLSPLSAPAVQVDTVSGITPAQPLSAEALQEPLSKLYLESMNDLSIVAETENHSALNLEAQKQVTPALIVDEGENEQHTVLPKMALFEPLKDALSGKGITGEIGTDRLALKESRVSAEYVDFKPFSPVLESRIIGQEASSLDDVFKMGGNCMNEADTKPPATESYDAKDKSSVPSESPVDSTHYIAAQTLEISVAAPDAEALPQFHGEISENQTDEKKIAEMEAHWSTDQIIPSIGATDPVAVEFKPDESGNLVKNSLMSAVAATNVSDSLTPDLVQEACESKMHDATGAQLTYTSKVDLVQTADSLPESLISEGQITPSFECTRYVQSPVLPDIVKEAPVNIGVPGLETQSGISPLEDLVPLVHEQQIKLGSEKPPSYEEAVNDPLTQTEKHIGSSAFEGFASVESTTHEEIGTPYISIACDLVKETKISNDDLPPGFSELSRDVLGDFASQSVPKYPQKDEESSPESEEMDFGRQWGSEIRREVSKVFAVSEHEKAKDVHSSTVLDESKLLSGLSPGKVYMESFQPESDLSKDPTNFGLGNPTVSVSTEEEKPLQMDELGKLISAEKMPGHWEQNLEDDSLCLGEPSPFPLTVDFVTKLDHLEAERRDHEHYMEKEENASMSDVTEVEFLGEVKPGKFLATAVEHLQSSVYSPDLHEVSAAHLLPKESAPFAREELVCSVKQEALEIEEPKAALSTQEEKGERPTPSVAAASLLSARLGKMSVVDLLYWRDIKKTGVLFGASLFLLLSLTVFSIVSVSAYIALALLSVTISYRIYRGVFQAIQKSDDGHPFKVYLDSDVAVSQELVQKYSNVALGHVNGTIKELRRLFLVEDLVDSLKFAVLMWVLTYVGALFNGLTLLILALISLFSVPIIYERHQTQIDHYLGLVNKNVKNGLAKIQAKIPGLKPKAE